MTGRATRRVEVGSRIAPRDLTTVAGDRVALPDGDRLVHLQLRRFAGCPVCNLHLRSVVRRLDEIERAGVREIVVFHSTTDDLRPHVRDLPVAVVADPDKQLYVEMGVESSRRALLDPRVWPTIVRAIAISTWSLVRGRAPAPSLNPEGGRYGLPADLLIAPDGTVVAVKYGTHAADQWDVDELLGHAADHAPTRPVHLDEIEAERTVTADLRDESPAGTMVEAAWDEDPRARGPQPRR